MEIVGPPEEVERVEVAASLFWSGLIDAITVDEGGLLYPARVSMTKTDMLVDGRSVPLDAGMSATVEVKIGQRRLMEFILAPIFRYRDESLGER